MIGHRWSPGPERARERLARVLEAWEGTRYMIGQQKKGAGVDCVRFVCGVLDELAGTRTPIETLPADVCMHDPESARRVVAAILEHFPADPVAELLEPGDVIVTGPVRGGPGHAMIVGPRPNTLWHATPGGVRWTGIGEKIFGHRVHAAYRLRSRPWADDREAAHG